MESIDKSGDTSHIEEKKQQKRIRNKHFKTDQCQFYNTLKKRLCGQPLFKDSTQFCRFHIGNIRMFNLNPSIDQSQIGEQMVACPYEPKYFMPKSKLQKHLLICPKIKHQKEALDKPWHTKAINIMNKEGIIKNIDQIQESKDKQKEDEKNEVNDQEVKVEKFSLKDCGFEMKDQLIEKIEKVYEQLRKKCSKDERYAQLFQVDEIVDRYQQLEEQMELEGKKNELSEYFKHSHQQSKIIDLMMKHGLITEIQEQTNLYVEFGAGRAGLSSYVANKLKELNNLKNIFLVVDRDTRRFKLDKEFKDVFKSYREKMDIADFDLKKFIDLQLNKEQTNMQIITIAKHLCGGATDLALTSMSLQKKELIKGVCIATCCHHCCDNATYVYLQYLKDLGFNDDEFQLLPRVTSWGISQKVKHRKKRVGLKVKRILEYGRCQFIQDKLGLETYTYQYCDPITQSPENTLLLAYKKQ